MNKYFHWSAKSTSMVIWMEESDGTHLKLNTTHIATVSIASRTTPNIVIYVTQLDLDMHA
jgi:hypothetical protein